MFRRIRSVFFWLHLAGGVVAGVLIFLIALTGVIISFERQMTTAANGFALAMPAEGRKLGVEETLTVLRVAEPAKAPTAIVIESDPELPTAVMYGKEKTLYLNPYDGKVLGEGAKGMRGFFQFVTSMHRWLAFQGSAKDLGQSINSAAALVFFFLILSGLVIWIPKHWSGRALKPILTFQGQMKGRAREWNWHNVFGIWFALPLLVICGTGLVIAYPWANALLFRAMGDTPPPQGPKPPPPPQAGWTETMSGWDAAYAQAVGLSKEWESIQFQYPAGKNAVFVVSDSHRGRPDLKQTLTVDLTSNSVVKLETFESMSSGKRARQWARWVHTGEAGGWPGQVLAALSAIAAVMLVWTGIALAVRRFGRWRKRGE
ncbi:PepSY domain-containing protein [Luteolibacter sp. GHJ8]|uniref:PepSY domain-containing protein n=1 Tax=Luteolibacter rhizosphaerae TaxID=2989719 RepID=A0ABT3FY66_9BACT|nr:PepSY-associated TM helix domain-containing protein [Luteolibacter rhizosphaerae]MCW1912521.1 PepSY domain-containing protein [Luteolibacter rhizosphaerae]